MPTGAVQVTEMMEVRQSKLLTKLDGYTQRSETLRRAPAGLKWPPPCLKTPPHLPTGTI